MSDLKSPSESLLAFSSDQQHYSSIFRLKHCLYTLKAQPT